MNTDEERQLDERLLKKADLVEGKVPSSELPPGQSGGDMLKSVYDPGSTGKIAEAQLTLNYATHSNANDPTAGQKAALVGTGTPSSTDKYVNDSDSRNSNARTPVSHNNTYHLVNYVVQTDIDNSISTHKAVTTSVHNFDASGLAPPTVHGNTSHSVAFLSANQTITLSGAVSGSGQTTISTTIGDIPGRLLSIQALTASTGTYTTPTTVSLLWIRAVAGGGGGGGASASTAGIGAGAGGGSGSYGELFLDSPTTSYAYVVGRGGTAGAGSTAATGGTGGSTSFGATPSLGTNGGIGGSGMVVAAVAKVAAGGVGGAAATTGDVKAAGSAGEEGCALSATVGFTGGGAPSHFGGAAAGRTTIGAGANGANYGAGGAGGLSNSTGAQAGGTGSAGVIIVMEFA